MFHRKTHRRVWALETKRAEATLHLCGHSPEHLFARICLPSVVIQLIGVASDCIKLILCIRHCVRHCWRQFDLELIPLVESLPLLPCNPLRWVIRTCLSIISG